MQTSLILPLEAKVWIYQSNKNLSLNEIDAINDKMDLFLSTWQSHGSDLIGKYEVVHNRFLVLSADESSQEATGCSIDKSVSLIKQLEAELDITLTDKSQVAYVNSNGGIDTVDFRSIKELIQKGDFNAETIIFDSSISTFNEYKEKWRIPAGNSWLSRYF